MIGTIIAFISNIFDFFPRIDERRMMGGNTIPILYIFAGGLLVLFFLYIGFDCLYCCFSLFYVYLCVILLIITYKGLKEFEKV